MSWHCTYFLFLTYRISLFSPSFPAVCSSSSPRPPLLTTSPLPLLFENFSNVSTISQSSYTLRNCTIAPHSTHDFFTVEPPDLTLLSLARSLPFSSLLFSSLPLLCFHPVYSLSRSPGLPAPGLRHPCSPSRAPVRDPNLVNHVRRFPNLQPVSPIRTLGDGTEPGPSLVNQARRAVEAGAEPEPILRSATACASTMPGHAFPTCPLSVCGVRCCKL